VLLMDVRRPIRAAALATLPAQIGALCWSPDGARLMAGGGDLVACVDSANGDVLLISHTPGRVALGFTPDGASLLAIDFSTATWLETRWPDEATLLARDRARLAMDWLRSERPWQINAAQAHTRLEQNHFHSAEVREKALALLSALREQPAQANNHAMLTSMAEKQRTDADRVQALEVLDAGIAQAPDAPNFYMTRSELLMQLQRFDEAVEAIEQARSLYAAAGITRVPLFDAWTALVRHRQGRTDESGRLLEQARATVAAEQDPELRASWQSELDEAVARIGQ
jgi:tetratricopeptide (TPR) repeat protein